MTLKRVCLFLAVAFLVVDVFLLVLCIGARNNLMYLSGDMIENAVRYFAANGIEMDTDVIVQKIPDHAVYTYADDNAKIAAQTAEKIQKKFYPDLVTSLIETPEGILYSYGDETGGTAATLRVYSSSDRFEYTMSDVQKEDLSSLSLEAFQTEDVKVKESVLKAAKDFLAAIRLVKNDTDGFSLCGVMETADGTYLCFEQNAGKLPIDSMYANVFVKNDRVKYAVGNILFAPFVKSYSQALTDGVNAIHAMNHDGVKAILAEEIVYERRKGSGGVYYLIPRWKITYFDTSDGAQIQYVDAIRN